MRRLIVLILLTLTTALAGAETYKWTDANGMVHYGQRPPQHSLAQKLSASGSPAAGSRRPESRLDNDTDQVAMSFFGSIDAAPILDCAKAVENGRTSLDITLQASARNYRNGHVTKLDYDTIVGRMEQIRSRLSVVECSSSKGDVREFYLCLGTPSGSIARCDQKHRSDD